ncbi:MAG: hypothetical protein H6779_02550 [Candidatus Nomurabacteria bacterium]|nr:hypothetical protein [Candidatus Nomurabacteria bacterium]USN87269.1 MAG: hypothetical protein H6779_02550 [Candidatus Nomurabacteria bacterium]
MKKDSHSDLFLEEMRKIPIVTVACEKVGISRNTIYKWLKDDPEFKEKFDAASIDGIEHINDLSENQLLQLIKEKKISAIRLWLTNNHQRFSTKSVKNTEVADKELSEEQKSTIEQALKMVNGKQNYGQSET